MVHDNHDPYAHTQKQSRHININALFCQSLVYVFIKFDIGSIATRNIIGATSNTYRGDIASTHVIGRHDRIDTIAIVVNDIEITSRFL